MPEISELTSQRLALGAAAVLPVRDAARLLPGREADNRKWLAARGLVIERPSGGGPVVVWGDVIKALREQAPDRPARRRRRRDDPAPSLRRADLS